MRKSIFPNGLTLSQLEDVDFPEHHTANAKPDSNFIVTMTMALILTQSSSLQMIHRFAQIPGSMMKCRLCGPQRAAGLGALAMCKLYFTKDIVDDSFVPRNRKPKPIPKPLAKPAPKPAPNCKHVQLFKMMRKVGKGFYSTAPNAPNGQ